VTAVLALLLANAVLAAVLALIVLALCALGRPSPAARHALWLVVLVKLLSPFGLIWSVPLPLAGSWLRAEPPVAVSDSGDGSKEPAEQAGAEMVSISKRPAAPTTFIGDRLDGSPLPTAEPTPRTNLRTARPAAADLHADSGVPLATRAADPSWWLTLVWLAGGAVVAACCARRTYRFWRCARRGRPASPGLRRQVAELAAIVGMRAPRVRVLAGLVSPVVWCLLRPVLLWPRGLEERLRFGGRRAVLVHELAHLRRRDHWVRWLELAAAVLHWWNPVFWLVRRQLRCQAELACDAWVTATLPESRRDYAEALLEVCTRSARAAAPSPAVGVGGDGRRDFQRRLTMIMRQQVPCRLAAGARLSVAALLLAALPAWTLGQGHVQSTANPKSDGRVFKFEDAPPQPATKFWRDVQTVANDNASAKKLQEIDDRIAVLHKELEDLQVARAAAAQKRSDRHVRYLQQKVAPEEDQRGALRYKVIGPDGKEIKGAKVIILEAKPATKKAALDEAKALADLARVQEKLGERLEAVRERAVLLDWVKKQQADRVLNLTRATYRLPKDKAAALATFLKDNVKAPVLELKLDGQGLTITTTPETQAAIGAMVRLLAQSQAGPVGTANEALRQHLRQTSKQPQ
jgi:beta-lactamase regulating signal transducer with metallopeptidase domain